jgi:hypothetical protein
MLGDFDGQEWMREDLARMFREDKQMFLLSVSEHVRKYATPI